MHDPRFEITGRITAVSFRHVTWTRSNFPPSPLERGSARRWPASFPARQRLVSAASGGYLYHCIIVATQNAPMQFPIPPPPLPPPPSMTRINETLRYIIRSSSFVPFITSWSRDRIYSLCSIFRYICIS